MKGLFCKVSIISLALSFACTVNADNIEQDVPITAVKLHPYSAVITRSQEIQFPAGQHQLIIGNLPQNIDPARLVLSIPDAAVRMGSLSIDESNSGSLTSENEQLLESELLVLFDARQVILDEITTANTELQLLSALATGGSEAGIRPTVNAEELANLIAVIGTSSNQARARIRDAGIQQRTVDEQIRVKQFELRQIATGSVVNSTVTAQLEVSSAVIVTVELSYPVANAWWEWLYEARLDTDHHTLSFFRQAVITQNTGEDWDKVDLILTTANPQMNTATPILESSFVDIREVVESVIVASSDISTSIFEFSDTGT